MSTISKQPDEQYTGLLGGVVDLLKDARQNSVRAVNSIMTATYWEIGRRIVEFEQGGDPKAAYGTDVLKRLGKDLTQKFGRGFGWRNLYSMRGFYLAYPSILHTASAKFDGNKKLQTLSAKLQTPESKELTAKSGEPAASALPLTQAAAAFPLPWSHYVRLLKVDSEDARKFYEAEALRGGCRCDNWIARSAACSTNGPLFRRTNRRCCPKARSLHRAKFSPLLSKSKIRLSSNSLT
jgi:hypothetical protein